MKKITEIRLLATIIFLLLFVSYSYGFDTIFKSFDIKDWKGIKWGDSAKNYKDLFVTKKGSVLSRGNKEVVAYSSNKGRDTINIPYKNENRLISFTLLFWKDKFFGAESQFGRFSAISFQIRMLEAYGGAHKEVGSDMTWYLTEPNNPAIWINADSRNGYMGIFHIKTFGELINSKRLKK